MFDNNIVLLFVQTVTESLPVSSNAHVLLTANFLNMNISSFSYLALFNLFPAFSFWFCFRKDVWNAIKSKIIFLISPLKSIKSRDFDMVYFKSIVIAVLPVLIVCLLLEILGIKIHQTLSVIAVNSMIFGTLLLWVDLIRKKESEQINEKKALLIGIMQFLSLIPGVSRMGICLTTARFCNLDRYESLKFSCITGIPILIISGAYSFLKCIYFDSPCSLPISNIFLYGFIAMLLSIIVLSVFINYIKKYTFFILGVYRILFGFLILILLHKNVINIGW